MEFLHKDREQLLEAISCRTSNKYYGTSFIRGNKYWA